MTTTPDQARLPGTAIATLEAELEAVTDQEVARFYNTLQVDDPRVDIVAGEMERRNIDD